ncbi:hypothetical protein C8J57DRAFT_1634705 [Mycena rebaudengoi]|nr:hypothetical protein C8J57DRAFT_1634705 [Mycena rebaudengoi]
MRFYFLTLHLFGGIVFAAQRNITVDDNHPAISYAGSGWETLTPSSAYNRTSHQACQCFSNSSSTATFNFTGNAIYYLASDFGFHYNTTRIILDGGNPETIDLTPLKRSSSPLTLWARTDLANGPHTIVVAAGEGFSAQVDALMYTIAQPDEVPPAPAGTQNVFLSADTFRFSDGWETSTDGLQSCVKSKQLRTTSVANSTFSFNFTGNELFLNTLASASGGKLSLSINDDAPEVFDTTAPTASCALLNLNVTALVKRSLLQRADSSSAEAQNQCVGKSVSGTTALDGVTYRHASSGDRKYDRSMLPLMLVVVVILAVFSSYPSVLLS